MALPEMQDSMTPLDSQAPLRSLRLLAGVSHQDMADAREPPCSKTAVINAEQAGSRIQLDTLEAYAKGIGYRVVLMVEPLPGRGRSTDR